MRRLLAVALLCAHTVSGQDSNPSFNHPEGVFQSVVDDGGDGGPSPSSTAELPHQDVFRSSEFEGLREAIPAIF